VALFFLVGLHNHHHPFHPEVQVVLVLVLVLVADYLTILLL